MGLFDRRRQKKNAIQVNDISPNYGYTPWTPWIFPHKKGDKPIGSVYLEAILNMLWKGMSNVTFESMKKESYIADAIVSFMDSNATLLLNQYLRLGFICICYDKDHNYWVPKDTDIKYDVKSAKVINKNAVVLYSPQYQTDRKSLAKIAFPIVLDMNKISGAQDYLTETLGTFFILSGNEIPINPNAKKQMLEGMKELYGTAADKYQFMLTQHDMHVTKIDPQIDELKFEERMKANYKLLANLFGVPTQLLLDDVSTYNNVREARIFFYENTIRYYAECLLKVARQLLTATGNYIPQSTITYRIENVPELEKTLSSACSERTALLDYLLKLREAGIDVDKEINELFEESKNMLKEV